MENKEVVDQFIGAQEYFLEQVLEELDNPRSAQVAVKIQIRDKIIQLHHMRRKLKNL